MKRVRRTFTMTETVERMLVVSKVNPTGEDCPSCAPGTGWLTLDEAVRIAGWPSALLLELTASGELHTRLGPRGILFICTISLSLEILKGDKENETHIS